MPVLHSKYKLPEQLVVDLRMQLLAGEPVRRAARALGVNLWTALAIRDDLEAEQRAALSPVREAPPEPVSTESRPAPAPPAAPDPAPAAKSAGVAPKRNTLEAQLARIRNGATLSERFSPGRIAPDMTLGGVGSGML